MLKKVLVIFIILFNSIACYCQSQFKVLLNSNPYPFIKLDVIGQMGSDYLFVHNADPFAVVLKLDASGNYLYHKLPRTYIGISDHSLHILNDKILFGRGWLSVLDSTGDLISKHVFYNDSIMGIPNVGLFDIVTDDESNIFYSGGINFYDTIYHNYPFVYKTDSLLNIKWSKYIPSVNGLATFFIHPIIGKDGGFYNLLSHDSTSLSHDFIYSVVKFDTINGNLLWAKKYLEPPYSIKNILPFDSSSFLLYGTNDDHENAITPYWDDSLIVVRVDTSGNVMWCRKYKTLAGVIAVNNILSRIINTNDNGFLLAGAEYGFQGMSLIGASIIMVKFDSQFNIQWARKHTTSFGGSGGKSVIQTNDGGYLVSGIATLGPGPNDVYAYIIKTDSLGSAGCEEDTLTGIAYTIMNVTPVDLNYTTDTISIYTAPVAIGDTMMGSFTEYDACVFLGVPEVNGQKSNGLLIYPNPATIVINIQLKPNTTATQIDVYDMQGRLMLHSNDVNSYPLQLNVAALVKGMYVLKVSCGESSFMGRVVVE
ncbi:MAG: T9SS type A sorting domain-containing protein [Bacteroidia bacterium]